MRRLVPVTLKDRVPFHYGVVLPAVLNTEVMRPYLVVCVLYPCGEAPERHRKLFVAVRYRSSGAWRSTPNGGLDGDFGSSGVGGGHDRYPKIEFRSHGLYPLRPLSPIVRPHGDVDLGRRRVAPVVRRKNAPNGGSNQCHNAVEIILRHKTSLGT